MQLAHRMVELQSALDPGRLSKRNKSSTHLLDEEKNRNACQAVRNQTCPTFTHTLAFGPSPFRATLLGDK